MPYSLSPHVNARCCFCKRLGDGEEEDRHVIDLLLEWDEEDPEAEWETLRQHVTNEILPLLNARDIADTEDYW